MPVGSIVTTSVCHASVLMVATLPAAPALNEEDVNSPLALEARVSSRSPMPAPDELQPQ